MSESPKQQQSQTGNRFESVLSQARQAHQVKAQAAIEARHTRQQAFENELSYLMRQEQPQQR